VIFENSAAGATVVGDLSQPLSRQKYVAVLVPYAYRLRLDALAKFVGGGASLKLADGADALTGFGFNGMTPVGSRTPIPLVVSRPVLLGGSAASPSPSPFPCVWLGGGDVDLKLRLFVRQLLRPGALAAAMGAEGPAASAYVPSVADCAEPRDGGDSDDD
jgi:prolyl-tRNA editing enzyme YbaK/EbsC (Cys-tRNA(Pro) deacylase)